MLKNIVKCSNYKNFDNNDSEQNGVSCEKKFVGEAEKLERRG